MNRIPLLTVRFVETEAEIASVQEFVQSVYGRTYGTRPSPPDSYVAIYRSGRVVGCLGAKYADDDALFPLEKIYALKREGVLSRTTKENTVQFARWASRERGVAAAAAYCMGALQIARGRTCAILDCNARTLNFIRSLGIPCSEIPSRGANLAHVEEHDRAAYDGGQMRPYHMDLLEICAVLSSTFPHPLDRLTL